MRALTQVRDGAASYPAVARLVALAAQVRSLLGPDVKLSYAADWSEYFGHTPQDGSGDRLFHLDPLWASDDIDFIGIDWYAPLSDWRNGQAHTDRQNGATSIYDPDYLAANVEGGEGYDWYYASQADREAQLRSPIADGAYSEPWVYRYKDLRSWWSAAHHDRIAGVRQAVSTAWVPQSKPVRLVELGCPAIDKGSNQPNVFLDPKSSESSAPYYSNASRDDLIQRRYIEALLGYWQGESNPVSSLYGGPMVDLTHSHVWTWDARPFPEFPAREDVWTDGANWRRGHWLTGRVGQSLVSDIVADVAARAGLDTIDTTRVEGVLAGYAVSAGVRARDEIERLGALFGFDLVDRAGGPECIPHAHTQAPTQLVTQSLALDDRGGTFSVSREPEDSLPDAVRIQFHADDGDYRAASASVSGVGIFIPNPITVALPALSDRDIAASWAQDVLARARAQSESASLHLPPSMMRLEAGDSIALDAGPQGRAWRIASADGVASRQCDLMAATFGTPTLSGPEPALGVAPVPPSRPSIILLDLPMPEGNSQRTGLWAVSHVEPWPGPITLYAGADVETATERVQITAPAFTGILLSPLQAGFEGRWDLGGVVHVKLFAGAFSSRTPSAILGGANRVAVETDTGWEVLSFAKGELEEDGSWTLSHLLRGLGGTPASGASAGSRVVVLDGAGAFLPTSDQEVGTTMTVLAVPPGKALNDISVRQLEVEYLSIECRPLSPAHLVARWNGDDIAISWVRRARIGGDAWGYGDVELDEVREAYEVTLLDGEVVVRTQEVSAPEYLLAGTALNMLFPAGVGDAHIRVAQISDHFGPGVAAQIALATAN